MLVKKVKGSICFMDLKNYVIRKKDERLSEFDERVKVIVADDVDVREDMLWALSKFCFLSSSLSLN